MQRCDVTVYLKQWSRKVVRPHLFKNFLERITTSRIREETITNQSSSCQNRKSGSLVRSCVLYENKREQDRRRSWTTAMIVMRSRSQPSVEGWSTELERKQDLGIAIFSLLSRARAPTTVCRSSWELKSEFDDKFIFSRRRAGPPQEDRPCTTSSSSKWVPLSFFYHFYDNVSISRLGTTPFLFLYFFSFFVFFIFFLFPFSLFLFLSNLESARRL